MWLNFVAKIHDFSYNSVMTKDGKNDPFAHLPSMMTDDTPEARAWRSEQANVDADIEGLAQSAPEDIAFNDALDQLDISDEEKMERLINYFREKYGAADDPISSE